MKKMLYILALIIGLTLAFLNGDKINILAFQKVENTLGSYPIQLDIENYNNKNLYDNNGDSNLMSKGFENGEVYTLRIFNTTEPYFYKISTYSSAPSGTDELIAGDFSEGTHFTFTFTYVAGKTWNLYLWNIGWSLLDLQNYDIMIVKGDILPTEYEPYYEFKFGYYIGYDIYINNTSNSSITTDINIYNNDVIVTTGTCTIPGNVTNYNCGKTIYTGLNGVISLNSGIGYIPFNITNEGYITFDSNLKVVLSNSNNLEYSNSLSSQITLQGVFKAYYKGNSTNNLYYKNTYLFNSWYIAASTLNANNDFMKIFYNDYTNGYTGLYESISFVNANESINVGKQNIVEIGYYSSNEYSSLFEYTYEASEDIFINASYLNCVITFSDISVNTMNNTMFSYNFSNISFNIANSVNGSIISGGNNSDISNKKNTCSGWYDIPCQLGNAITYVIYEAPIISPVVSFIETFKEGIQYVIIYIKWFEGIGILFSLFIFILMIRLLIMMIKGSNDDRGGKK